MNSQTTYYAERAAAIAMLAGITYLIMIIATAPDLYTDPAGDPDGQICIEDDAPFYPDPHPPEFYEIIYPKDAPDVIRDKNGEIVTMDQLPSPATRDPADTPDGYNAHPVMPWIEQSMTGQSPPVLYWPAPVYKQTLKKPAKPCTDRYKPVTEPGILALIGAALLAMAVVK